MLTLQYDRDNFIITITDEVMLSIITDSVAEKIGRTTAEAIKRRRRILLCERDGHIPFEMRPDVCARCFEKVSNVVA